MFSTIEIVSRSAVDPLVELGRRGADPEGAGAAGSGEDRVGGVARDDHLVIGLARPQQLLQVGELERPAGDDPVARKFGEPRLHRGLVLLPLRQRGAKLGDPRRSRRGRRLCALEAGQLDPAPLDVAGQVDRLAEQARSLVAAAGKLARQHRLGLGDAGAKQHLAGREQVGDRGRIVAARGEQGEIGFERAPEARRAVAFVGGRGDDLAVERQRRLAAAGARIIAGEPALRAEQSRGARIVGLEQGDGDLMLAFGLGLIAARLGDVGELAVDLRAQPDGGRDPAAADRDQLVERSGEGRHGVGVAPLETKHDAAQVQGLAVEDLRLVLRGQSFLAAKPARAGRFGAEPAGGRPVDDEVAHAGGEPDRRHRPVELGGGLGGHALVEQVDGAIVAQPPRGDRIGAGHRGRPREERIRLGIAAEIGLLQRFVDHRLGLVERAALALAQGREEFRGFGIGAGIVAAIGLGQRPLRIERSGLHPGEGGGIAGAGGRDRNLSFDRPVGDQAVQRQRQRAVIAGQPFGDVERIAPADADRPGRRHWRRAGRIAELRPRRGEEHRPAAPGSQAALSARNPASRIAGSPPRSRKA